MARYLRVSVGDPRAQTLNAEILAGSSATQSLEKWCRDHKMAADPIIVARVMAGIDKAPTSEQLQRLQVTTANDVKHRHVELRCGSHILSEADAWYVPSRLTADMDDSSGSVAGQVYLYVGEKVGSANPIEAAGLSHGQLFGIQVSGLAFETAGTAIPDGTRFALYPFGNVSGMTGAAIESLSVANGVTAFLRPEDGAWDPSNPNDFYFYSRSCCCSAS